MATVLDGVNLKIVRAQEHLRTLKDEIAAYLDTEPYSFRAQNEDGMIEVTAMIKQHPPLHLAAVVGDCLGNLRACLDYIIWEICARHKGSPMVIDKDRPDFPICSTSAKYAEASNRLAKFKIAAPILGVLKQIQPYHTGYEPLCLLRILVNQDKHRLPVLGIGVSSGMDARVEIKGGVEVNGDPLDVLVQATGASSMSMTAPVHFPVGDVTDYVKMEGYVSCYVAFQNLAMPREPLDITLENILTVVRDSVVPKLVPFI